MPFPADPLQAMPCMRCGKGKWEVVWDDGVMEYALCRACVKIMEKQDKDTKKDS